MGTGEGTVRLVVMREINWPIGRGKNKGWGRQAEPAFLPGARPRESRLPAGRSPRRWLSPRGRGGRRWPKVLPRPPAVCRLLTVRHLPVADVLQVVALAGSEIQLCGLQGSGRRCNCHRVPSRRLIDLRLVVRLCRPRAPAHVGAGTGLHATGQRVPHGVPTLLAAVAASVRPRTPPRSAAPLPQQWRGRHGQPRGCAAQAGSASPAVRPAAGPPGPGQGSGPGRTPRRRAATAFPELPSL